MMHHKQELNVITPPRRRLLPFFLLCSFAMGSEACQNSKKKTPTKKVISENSGSEQEGAGTAGNGTQRTSPASTKPATSNDVSQKLTADERSLLGNFACQYKGKTDKVVNLAKMINDSDSRKVIDDLGKSYDPDKVKALINLAKKIGSSKTKAEATLKSLCSSKSEDTKSDGPSSDEEPETEDGSDNKN